MKKFSIFILAVVLIFSFVSCNNENSAEETEENYLEYNYDLTEYISFCDPTSVEAEFDDPEVCSEEEIDEALYQIMLTYADFNPVEGRCAEKYDKVTVNYTGFLGGEPLSDLSADNFDIIIGLSGNDDVSTVLQNELIGKTAGETVRADYTYPDNSFYYGEYAGKNVSFVAEIVSVSEHIVFDCTDEFVQTLDSYNFKTVQEFRDSLRQDILDEKQSEKITAVWNAFYDTVEVKKYPTVELDAYYKDYVDYYESCAAEYNVSLEEFIKQYFEDYSIEALYSEAKEYAEYMTKNDMVFILLAKTLGTEITEEEYQNGVNDYYAEEMSNYETKEDFIKYYGEKNLRRNVLWDKALVEMASFAKMK